MAAWHWAGLAISAEVLQLKVRANQEKKKPGIAPGLLHASLTKKTLTAQRTQFGIGMALPGTVLSLSSRR